MKNLLRKLHLYGPLVNIKRKIDRIQHNLSENRSLAKRFSFYKALVQPGDLVFDVGANVGNRTGIFRKLGAKVVAVEPQQACVNTLRSKFGNDLMIEQVGLGAEEGELDFHIADESTISTFSSDFIEKTGQNKFRRNKWERTVRIPITTLDKLITKHGTPSFCKIDVEGFEPKVLSGLSSPIPLISFEYNVPDLASNVYECLNKLHSLSPKYVFNYCVGESMSFASTGWMDYKEFEIFVHSPDFLNTDFGDIYAEIKS